MVRAGKPYPTETVQQEETTFSPEPNRTEVLQQLTALLGRGTPGRELFSLRAGSLRSLPGNPDSSAPERPDHGAPAPTGK